MALSRNRLYAWRWPAWPFLVLCATAILTYAACDGVDGPSADPQTLPDSPAPVEPPAPAEPAVTMPSAMPGGSPLAEAKPGPEPSPSPPPPPEPRSRPKPEPPPKPEATLIIAPETIHPGESARVEVRGAGAAKARVTAEGRTAPLVSINDAVWLGYISVTPIAAEGTHTLTVGLLNADGELLDSLVGEFIVKPLPSLPPPTPEETAAQEPVEAIMLPPEVITLLTPENAAIDDRVRFELHSNVSGPPRWSGPWIRPVDGQDDSPFGILRSYNGGPVISWHHGHDIVADQGQPIWTAAAGVVVFAGTLPIHGQGVIVDHGAGVFSGYWHMAKISVAPDMELLAGHEIGLIGSTGASTGPHLHWEVIVNGRDVNPLQWLEAELHP